MENNNQNNNFKFGIFYKDRIISQSIFNADIYNHICRYTVNIKDWANLIKHEFQEVLSKRDKDLNTTLNGYNILLSKEQSFFGEMDGKDIYTQEINGVEDGFKYKLQINDSIIIERVFPVKKFNYKSIYSSELVNLMSDWVERIEERIKLLDEQQMWEEETILTYTKLSREDIRKLSKEEKETHLKRISKY